MKPSFRNPRHFDFPGGWMRFDGGGVIPIPQSTQATPQPFKRKKAQP
jgi:hypothetical protein